MNWLYLSNLIQWIVIALLAGLFLFVSRQMGTFMKNLSDHMIPAKSGPSIGVDGSSLIIPFAVSQSEMYQKLVLLLSSDCSACKELAQSLPMLNIEENLNVFAYVQAQKGTEEDIVKNLIKAQIPYTVVQPSFLNNNFSIKEFPMAILLDKESKVRAKYLGTSRSVANLCRAPGNYIPLAVKPS